MNKERKFIRQYITTLSMRHAECLYMARKYENATEVKQRYIALADAYSYVIYDLHNQFNIVSPLGGSRYE